MKESVQEQNLPRVESNSQSSPELIKKISRSLTERRFPLSQRGVEVKNSLSNQEVTDILPENLPTVENPHLEYFEDLDIPDRRELLGMKLANVQITKGCRHACTFCAAGASRTVETMPYQAILKIGEQMKEVENQVVQEWVAFCKELGCRLNFDSSFMYDDKFGDDWDLQRKKLQSDFRPLARKALSDFFDNDVDKANEYLISLIREFPLIEEYFENQMRQTPELVSTTIKAVNKSGLRYDRKYFLSDLTRGSGFPFHVSQLFWSIANYYDSDPFDYKDNNFSHVDGSPADFGDVALALATKKRPLHITTAGWSKTDHVAQNAAQKIVNLGTEYFFNTRISVNQFEIRARNRMDTYIVDTINTIKTLLPLGPQVILFGDKDFVSTMREELEKHLNSDDLKKIRINTGKVSNYSGHVKSEHGEKDHDVMACMPGYHIWPDGTVAVQKKIVEDGILKKDDPLGLGVERGTRPMPVGEKIW
ncbi:MAG: hypothetical protein PHF79_00255 [Candidatus Pacebacteria bacterium]|nr:hypothetical protein [Candidatus Paceibacterota bacterium]